MPQFPCERTCATNSAALSISSVWRGARRPQVLIKGTAVAASGPDITGSRALWGSSRSPTDGQHRGASVPRCEGARGRERRPGSRLGIRGPGHLSPPPPPSPVWTDP